MKKATEQVAFYHFNEGLNAEGYSNTALLHPGCSWDMMAAGGVPYE
jgi:hypothetical protein